MIPTISEKVIKLVNTGRVDSEGSPIYGCTECGTDLENITGGAWSELIVVRCPKCHIDWEVDYE